MAKAVHSGVAGVVPAGGNGNRHRPRGSRAPPRPHRGPTGCYRRRKTGRPRITSPWTCAPHRTGNPRVFELHSPLSVARPPRRAEGIKHARGARTQHGPRNGPNSSSETQPKRLPKVPGGCFGVRVLRRFGTHKIARCGSRTFLRQPSQARGAGSSTTTGPAGFLW